MLGHSDIRVPPHTRTYRPSWHRTPRRELGRLYSAKQRTRDHKRTTGVVAGELEPPAGHSVGRMHGPRAIAPYLRAWPVEPGMRAVEQQLSAGRQHSCRLPHHGPEVVCAG